MLIVGLTGGIGSGKSTIAAMFEKLDVPIIDADDIAHKLVTPGSDASTAIAATFGEQLFADNGELDRGALRDIVFADEDKRKQLEDILHPRIQDAIRSEVEKHDSHYCIVVIPLLIETGGNPLIDRVLVVDCPEDLQLERVRQRNRLSAEQVQAIMAAQASRRERLEKADDVIDNSGSTHELEQQVNDLHRQYLDLSDPG